MTHPWPVPSSQFQTERLDLRFWLKAIHVRSLIGTLITFKVMDLFTLELLRTGSCRRARHETLAMLPLSVGRRELCQPRTQADERRSRIVTCVFACPLKYPPLCAA